MQQDTEEQSYYHRGGGQCPDRVTRIPVAEEGKEDQEQQKGPVNFDLYAENPAYLERAAHASSVP